MKTFFRTAALVTAFSVPLVSSACKQSDEKPEVPKPQEVKLLEIKPVDKNLKNNIDEKRKVLEKKEREFASELGGWSSCELPNVLLSLYMISEDKEKWLTGVNIAKKLVKRHEDFVELTGNHFSIKKPNEEQVESFSRVINMAQKGANIASPSVNKMTPHGIAKKIEAYLKKTNPELKGEKLKKEVEYHLEYFTEYQKAFKKLQGQYMGLNIEIHEFNQDAKKAGEADHEPVWGLSSKRLAELLETFALRREGAILENKIDNIQTVKTKEILDKERNEIEKSERELASNLHKWARNLSDILWESHLVVDLQKGELDGTIYGRQISKSNDRFLGCPFLTVPRKNQIIEEFDQVLIWSIKGANHMKKYVDLPEDALAKRLESGIIRRNNFQNLKYIEKEMKDAVQGYLKDYSTYRTNLPKIIDQSAKLLTLMETFDKDALLAKQSPYEPVLGLNQVHLKELKSLNQLN